MPNQYTDKSNFKEITKKRLQNTIELNENGCWIWKGYKCEPKKLYGLTSVAIDGKKRKILAHRLSYLLWNGNIPKGLFVLHSCDTPLCINPEHLHLGTAKKNSDEMKERGREKKATGRSNSSTKLCENIVCEIRSLYKKGMTQRQISEKYKICSSNVNSIIHYRTWKYVI